jgi:hypothetical protein
MFGMIMDLQDIGESSCPSMVNGKVSQKALAAQENLVSDKFQEHLRCKNMRIQKLSNKVIFLSCSLSASNFQETYKKIPAQTGAILLPICPMRKYSNTDFKGLSANFSGEFRLSPRKGPTQTQPKSLSGF